MTAQAWLDILARWVHILSIVAWSGGSIFILAALAPAMGAGSAESRGTARAALLRFRQIMSPATVMVLLSGIVMLAVRISYVGFGNLGARYQSVLMVKVLIGLVLIGLAHASFARVAEWSTEEGQEGPPILAPRASLVLAVLAMLLGVVLHRL